MQFPSESQPTIRVAAECGKVRARPRQESPVIRNFSDHAANERTFLAWVRTAIALIGFGFVVERFNLFLRASRSALNLPVAQLPNLRFGEEAGIGLILLGVAIVAVAA
jgi:putative membrane protein